MESSSFSQTISSSPLDTGAIVNRVATAARLRAALPDEPQGPMLIYEIPESNEVGSIPLELSETIVGRVPLTAETPLGSHLAFPLSKKLSARHFSIRRNGDSFILEDLSSKNGTYLNAGAKPVESRVLVETDLINAGGIVFAFLES